MDAKLIVVGGKARKGSVALKLPMIIGRGREAGLTIVHPMISRRHCELFEADGLLMVRDLGSLNGTVIDGRRIKESPLPPEGKFAIGPLTFRAQYEYEGDLNVLPDAVLADPVAPQPERQESWSDSPESKPADDAIPCDPLTEAAPAADEAEVELSFSEDLQGEQPAAPAKPAVSKKKGGKAAKQLGKAPVDRPPTEKEPTEASEVKKPADAPEPESNPASPKKPAVNPADDEFDVDAFLDG